MANSGRIRGAVASCLLCIVLASAGLAVPHYASAEGTPPVAHFDVSASFGHAGSPLGFNASESSDAVDPLEVLEVRWDWESDGTWDTNWTTNKTATHIYQISGKYNATLEVRNSLGLTDVFVSEVRILPGASTPSTSPGTPAWVPWAIAVLVAALAAVLLTVLFRRIRGPNLPSD